MLVTHPFGPPMEATIRRDGDQYVMTWTAAEDDWMVIGDVTGAFEERAADESGEDALADSAGVQDFLAPQLVVSQAGAPCAREWLPTRDLLEEGVRMAFSCPDPEGEVAVDITALQEINEAYRTVLNTGGDHVLLTASDSTTQLAAQDVKDVGYAEGPSTAMLVMGGAVALVVLLVVVWSVVLHRSSRARAAEEVAA